MSLATACLLREHKGAFPTPVRRLPRTTRGQLTDAGHDHSASSRDTHPPPQGLQHPQSKCHPVPCQFHRRRRRLPSLQSWGSGGLLHLPGHLTGHRLVPLWVHLLFRLEEAKMSQLWSQLYLKGTAHLALLHPAVFF